MTLTGLNALTGQAVDLTADGERITALAPIEDRAGLPFLSPGFLDAQVNGIGGLDYSGPRVNVEMIHSVVDRLRASGTTRHVPTIITSPAERIIENLALLAEACNQDGDLARAIPAIHVEGPFISPEDGPRGAHDPANVRDPDPGELREWYAAAGGRLRVITLAPERPGALRLIELARELGLIVAIGHTAADREIIRRAVDSGATLSTHLGNGSHARLPRLDNYLWEQLGEDRLRAGVIADGYHLPDSVLRVFCRTKGLGRLMLVSDVAASAGLPPGRHEQGPVDVEVHRDGHLSLAGTEFLAGAGHLLDRGLAVFARATGLSVTSIAPLVTNHPARFLGLPEPRLSVGAELDLVVFRWDGIQSHLQIEDVLLPGPG